jgi:uncharacterized membrane protein
MKAFLSVSQLKGNARESLLMTLNTAVLANLLYFLIFGLLIQAEQSILPKNADTALLIEFVLLALVFLFMGVFRAGLELVYLKIAYGIKPRVRDLFSCVRENADKALAVRAVTAGIPYLGLLPAALYYHMALGRLTFSQLQEVDLTELVRILGRYSVLLILPLVLLLAVETIYGIVYYVMLDYPELTARQTLARARELTRGHRGRLLKLHLSFILLYLLCFFSMGMAVLWLLAYHVEASAAFYKDRMTVRNHNGEE